MKKPLFDELPCFVKINVTPIIDVALVLVIILLVTAPMISVADLDIKLPTAHTRGAEDEHRISVSYSSEGQLAVDDQMVSLSSLAGIVRSRLGSGSGDQILVVVRADAQATHGEIRAIMREIKSSGARRVAVATNQSGSERP
jgi:biopolymer transport protein TolR